MKLLSIVIAVGLSAHFWTDRIEYIPGGASEAPILINKWTGRQCVFYPAYEAQTSKRVNEALRLCSVNRSNGKIEIP